MRRLVVIRHAKAERESPNGDHGRELSKRGRAQAAALREWTEEDAPLGDVRGTVIVSDARRTMETFELGLKDTPVCERVVVDPSLYNGIRHVSSEAVLESFMAHDPGTGDLIHVGHNPTVAYLVDDLMDPSSRARRPLDDGYPLCSVAILAFPGDRPSPGTCELMFFEAPEI
jgi:phosphohistidine phosphatase